MSGSEVLMPAAVRRLRRDRHGRPVPWFTAWVDGQPDFRVVDGPRLGDAARWKLCWVCGQPRGAYLAYVVGPMSAVNRMSAEPPAHRACAVYSATRCPFLATPEMRRRTSGIPPGVAPAAGLMIRRNPGVTLVWVTRQEQLVPVDDGGVLWRFGDPFVGWDTRIRPPLPLVVPMLGGVMTSGGYFAVWLAAAWMAGSVSVPIVVGRRTARRHLRREITRIRAGR